MKLFVVPMVLISCLAAHAAAQVVHPTSYENTFRAAREGEVPDDWESRVAAMHSRPQIARDSVAQTWDGPNRLVMYDVLAQQETLADFPTESPAQRWIPGTSAPLSSDEIHGRSWTTTPTPITTTGFPWSTHVRITYSNSTGSHVASGTLIDPYHVITAATTVHEGAGGTWSSGVTVYPAWDGEADDAFGSAAASNFGAMTAWISSSASSDNMAWIRLNRPIGFLTGYLGYGVPNSADLTTNFYNLAAYPTDTCYTGAPDAMYYSFGTNDTIGSSTVSASVSWPCNGTGMEGGGAYSIISSERFVHGVLAEYQGGGTPQLLFTTWNTQKFDFYVNSMETPVYSAVVMDLVPMGCKADTGGAPTHAGKPLEGFEYLLANASDVDPPNATYVVDVYVSSNNNISEFDTLIQTQIIDLDFGPREAITVVSEEMPVLPLDLAGGDYWVGVLVRSANSDTSNDDTDGTDASPIAVTPCDVEFEVFGEGTPGLGNVIPVLYGVGNSCILGNYEMRLAGARGGSRGILWMGFGEVQWNLFGGTFLIDLTQPYYLFNFALGGPQGVPGAGSFDLPGAADLVNYPGVDIYFQWTVKDDDGPDGWALSNGLRLHVN